MSGSFWGGLLLAVVTIQVLVIWSIRRHRDPSLQIDCDAPIDKLMPSLSGVTLSTALPGNKVVVHENGAFFDVLIARIRAARESVHFETYLWEDGELARRIAEALIDRARARVQVRVLLDAQGSKKAGKEVVERMRAAGCQVAFFHKKALRNIGVFNDRDHRKMVVIDGKEAFAGGHCIVDHWLGNAEDGKHFGDVSLELHGPIVHSLQGAFSENWVGETGELFLGDDVFPVLEPAGDALIHAVYAKPENSAPTVKILHHTAICVARERIWIQNPYFIPEPAAIDAFGAAVKRGVDVRVLMPSTSGSDNPMVQHAGHRNFEKLLRCGVRLFEYPHTLLHQKIMTVDRAWTAIGSSNFDDRSFETNDEISLSVSDRALAARLDAIFVRYVQRATEIHLERWTRRSWSHKLKDNAFYLLNELL
jgi:cardiolipin synthase A/B